MTATIRGWPASRSIVSGSMRVPVRPGMSYSVTGSPQASATVRKCSSTASCGGLLQYGVTTRTPSAPAFSASSASSTVCRVPAVPAPVTIEARFPTASRTARTSAAFSASVVVGDSPVVPLSTSPSQPPATSRSASRWAPSRSSAPDAVKGVIMAHRTRPKGGAEDGPEEGPEEAVEEGAGEEPETVAAVVMGQSRRPAPYSSTQFFYR